MNNTLTNCSCLLDYGVGEALSGKISRLSLSELLFLLKIRMFIPFFAATQKDFALFLYLCTR